MSQQFAQRLGLSYKPESKAHRVKNAKSYIQNVKKKKKIQSGPNLILDSP